MHVVVVGMNYRTAPVEIRERFALSEQQLTDALQQLLQVQSVSECVIVSTCNRTEWYVVVDRMHMCGHDIRHFMEQWYGVERRIFTPYLYIHESERAIEHLFRVTAGLDSMVVGETQILGQIRQAFLHAQEQGATGTCFNHVFKQAITFAKRAHAETSINDNAVSVSYAAIELGKRIFGTFAGKKVLILGAGKMSELTVKHLYSQGAAEVMVANRTLQRAEELAEQYQGRACTLEKMDMLLPEADIVISSTGSPSYVLRAQDVEKVMKQRRTRPLFLIDIAVPRDLDPAIGEVSNVFLYDIDDLEGIVQSNLEQRDKAAHIIEDMIEMEIVEYRQWLKMLGIHPLIRSLQTKANRIHEDTLDSMFKKLPDLSEREAKVIRQLTKSMLNQMMQDPILQLKDLAAGKNGADAMHYFAELFALEEEEKEKPQTAPTSLSRKHEERASHPEQEKPKLNWAAVTW
ncbi:glutamyl-tRNA reductase [Paenibacillus aquistagni]|uniref:glutamyl-tRNA reductase n=1 Tax=Paenibacillus aquistagni TaxID=1852522 RepID=UPI000B50E2FF|nr:glutamyl-tRNA reductase [Paenibacillus aquistagni]